MDPKNINKRYTKGDLTVNWNASLCIHSANCVKGLPGVFNTRNRPWINMEGGAEEDIIRTVKNCPSGALSFELNQNKPQNMPIETTGIDKENMPKISISKDGPYMVEGNCMVMDADGNEVETKRKFFLCRCGASSNKPFCDGTHKKAGFKG
jgi:uncharacterized Fe-S cluster protein YjdI